MWGVLSALSPMWSCVTMILVKECFQAGTYMEHLKFNPSGSLQYIPFSCKCLIGTCATLRSDNEVRWLTPWLFPSSTVEIVCHSLWPLTRYTSPTWHFICRRQSGNTYWGLDVFRDCKLFVKSNRHDTTKHTNIVCTLALGLLATIIWNSCGSVAGPNHSTFIALLIEIEMSLCFSLASFVLANQLSLDRVNGARCANFFLLSVFYWRTLLNRQFLMFCCKVVNNVLTTWQRILRVCVS